MAFIYRRCNMKGLSRARRKASIAPHPTTANALVKNGASSGKLSVVQVQPERSTSAVLAEPSSTLFTRIKPHELAHVLYHWATCLFIVGLVCSQMLGAVWDSRTTVSHLYYGRNPQLGPAQIVGTNDIPFPDRVVACVRRGQSYEPRLVSSLLATPGVSAILEDSTGSAIHGYRLRQRRVGSVSDSLDSTVQAVLEASCVLIAKTIDSIADACLELGYTNLTRDSLRVVGDWDSNDLYRLPNTLPVLIMPYYESAAYASHAVPTWGGDACIFRLEDAYGSSEDDSLVASFKGVNQSTHHERTIAWLNRPGGTWKNGWYEEEKDCSDPDDCEMANGIERWGDKFSYRSSIRSFSSVYVANGTEFGLFVYQAYALRIVRSAFDWETLLSNVYTWWILHRWALAQSLTLGRARRGNRFWCGVGISCVSASKSFTILPLVSLPRLKMTLAAFWTVGCSFQGQQGALTEAWFAIYPAIVHLVLIYFSILNTLGKALRLRVSDVLFAPTVVAFCLMHYFRLALGTSGWLSGVDGAFRRWCSPTRSTRCSWPTTSPQTSPGA
jgi:hypothetical protein